MLGVLSSRVSGEFFLRELFLKAHFELMISSSHPARF